MPRTELTHTSFHLLFGLFKVDLLVHLRLSNDVKGQIPALENVAERAGKEVDDCNSNLTEGILGPSSFTLTMIPNNHNNLANVHSNDQGLFNLLFQY